MSKQIGAVVYMDDNIVFRVVYPVPGDPDDILDDPQWVTMGVDPNRKARMVKLDERHPDWLQFAGIEPSIAPGGFRTVVSKQIEEMARILASFELFDWETLPESDVTSWRDRAGFRAIAQAMISASHGPGGGG